MILIRLNVSKKIGTGHFRRMKVLSHMLKEKVIFLVNTDNETNKIFSLENIYFTSIAAEHQNFTKLTKRFNIKVILLDLLRYKKKYIEKLKTKLNCKIVAFHEYDDYSKFANISFNCNVIKENKKLKAYKVYYGSKYLIINNKIKIFDSIKSKNYIYINFGGSDPSKFLDKFIKVERRIITNHKFIIDIGAFKEKTFQIPQGNYKIRKSNQCIYKIMSESKLNLISAGNIMYESIYLRKKSIVLAHNKHQEKFAKTLFKKGHIKYEGIGDKIDFEKLVLNLKKPNYYNFAFKKTNIDILGANRIANLIENLL